jgi:Tol biopolymer transport system component
LLGISDRGDLAYVPGTRTGNQLVWVGRDGTRSALDLPRRSYQPEPRLSTDGRKVAVPIGDLDHYLWSLAIDTGVETLVRARDAHAPVWSPDGRKVAFPLYGTGERNGLAIKDLESAGEPDVVLEDAQTSFPHDWSSDGATILLHRRAGERFELAALTLRDRTTTPLLSTRQPIEGARLSPDGRWLAYASVDSGRRDVYVTDLPAARVKKQFSTDGGFAPVWAHDGSELFYLSGGRMMAATVRRGTANDFDRPVALFDGLDVAGNQTPFSVTADGRFLMVEAAPGGVTHIGQLTLVLNWVTELDRLVPTR